MADHKQRQQKNRNEPNVVGVLAGLAVISFVVTLVINTIQRGAIPEIPGWTALTFIAILAFLGGAGNIPIHTDFLQKLVQLRGSHRESNNDFEQTRERSSDSLLNTEHKQDLDSAPNKSEVLPGVRTKRKKSGGEAEKNVD